MKKTLLIICVIFIIIMTILFMNLKNVQKVNLETKKFNSGYEFYKRDDLCGIDITTIINKAIDNNEKYEIPKDSSGAYIPDNEYSVNIYVTMIINNKTYPMESIKEIGMESFTVFFGEVNFKCTDIEYHEKTGRIAKMVFESIDY